MISIDIIAQRNDIFPFKMLYFMSFINIGFSLNISGYNFYQKKDILNYILEGYGLKNYTFQDLCCCADTLG